MKLKRVILTGFLGLSGIYYSIKMILNGRAIDIFATVFILGSLALLVLMYIYATRDGTHG